MTIVCRAVRLACVMVAICSGASCNSADTTVSEFPGVAIGASCREGSTAPRYSDVDAAYPGERASGDLVSLRFLNHIGELPLPCLERRAEIYRFHHHSGGEFRSVALTVGLARSGAGARVWVVERETALREEETRRAEKALLETEWNQLAAELSAMKFWSQPSLLLPDRNRVYGFRASWIVEGYSGGRYHAVERSYGRSRHSGDLTGKPPATALIAFARKLLEAAR